ncbi:MAG TPA: hypothetical protein VEB66_00405 [Opitutaceae bacterium]|nr:hypothetical protein [Opitutaceae bacterium]
MADDDRATFTFRVNRLSYAELWRLADRSLVAYAMLIWAKWTDSPRFNHMDTTTHRPTFVTEPPAVHAVRLAPARQELERLGFRYVGCEEEMLRAGGALAHFLRGAVLAVHLSSARLEYTTFMSFPAGRKRIATANGRGYVEFPDLHDAAVLSSRTPIGPLLARHLERIASLALPDLTEAAMLDELERLSRAARAQQLARGVLVPAPLAPPLLPRETR